MKPNFFRFNNPANVVVDLNSIIAIHKAASLKNFKEVSQYLINLK